MKFAPKQDESGDHWMSISDLMSVLMMVFLFIAISYMVVVKNEFTKVKEIAVTYSKLQSSLYHELHEEFKDDLDSWNAEIDSVSISVRFKSPDVLFEAGQAQIKPKFKRILNDFFPRYLTIITDSTYIKDIESIKIEGHTSSDGKVHMNFDQAYIYNMDLSQQRAFNTFQYIYRRLIPRDKKKWAIEHLTANGMSCSQRKFTDKGAEDYILSRRVEFKIKTNAEKRIIKIVQQ